MMKLSMDKLVARTNGAITKQSISRYERGIMRPKRDALRAIAQALNISEEYFKGTNLKIDIPMLRTTSDGKLSEEELQSLEARLSFWAEQYLTKERLVQSVSKPDKEAKRFERVILEILSEAQRFPPWRMQSMPPTCCVNNGIVGMDR